MTYQVDGTIIEQFCADINSAHDELMKALGATAEQRRVLDWPEWTPQANSIRWAEKLLGKKLAKTNQWTLFPEEPKRSSATIQQLGSVEAL